MSPLIPTGPRAGPAIRLVRQALNRLRGALPDQPVSPGGGVVANRSVQPPSVGVTSPCADDAPLTESPSPEVTERPREASSADAAHPPPGAAERAGAPPETSGFTAPPESTQVLIVDTGASRRVINALGRVGILDLGALRERTPSELQAIPNLGAKSIAEIHEILDRSEMTLASETGTGMRPPPRVADVRPATRPQRETATPKEDHRLADIIERKVEGQTLAEIGRAHGLSRQRVQQILRRNQALVDEKREARATHERQAASDRRDEILAAFRRGDRPEQIAAVLGVREPAVKELISACASDTDRAARRSATVRNSEQRYSDDDLVEAVKEVAERYGRTPSTGEYTAAATGGMLPSIATVNNRLGWANAVERAGFTPRGRKRQYTRRWTAPACRAALIRLHLESGHLPTIHEYEQLAQLDPDLPSLATVRQRMGSWSGVTSDLLRLPTAAEALERCAEGTTDSAPESSQIWLAFLEERLSQDDVGALAVARRFQWSGEFGEIPDWLGPLLVGSDEGDESG